MVSIEIVRPEFSAGSEKRFSEFIGALDGKLALISHTDLDGLASAKVANAVLQADMLEFLDYEAINDSLVSRLKKNKIKTVVFTDISIDESKIIKKIEKFARILIIDHHKIGEDFNSEKTVFLNAQGYCAAYICYYLFSKIRNIEKLDWFIACACVADWQYILNNVWINSIYEKYGDKFIGTIEGVKKSTKLYPIGYDISLALIYFDHDFKNVYDKIGDSFGEIGDLKKYASIVLKEINEYGKKFEKEKAEISDGYFWEIKSKFGIKAILINQISSEYLNKTIIFASIHNGNCSISARRQDGKVDVSDLCKKLVGDFGWAGGHARAAGGNFPEKYFEEFKKKLFAGG